MLDKQSQGSAVVTGATSGVGRVLALHLASEGMRVTGLGRDTAALAELTDGGVLAIQADVRDAGGLRRAFDQAESERGPVELVIACAGVAAALGPVVELDADAWWQDVTTDLLGTFLTAQEAARRMVARRGGRLITTYGNLGDRGTPNLSAFASAKAAVARLSECLAAELREAGVLVFCVHPGFVRTRMTQTLAWGEAGQRYLPRFGERAEAHWGDGREATALVDEIRAGRADALAGRVLFVDDDLAALSEQVTRSPDLRKLRITLDAT